MMLTASALWPVSTPAQEALQSLKALDTSRDQRRTQMAADNFTVRQGDFRLRAAPSLGLDWNDNVNTSDANRQSDVIIRPAVQLDASYPLTQVNLLNLNLGLGYDKYLDQDDLSSWRINSGSALSFDVFIRDFNINFHDRISYYLDSAGEAAVANTSDYGNLENTIGVSASWHLPKATLTLGFDHTDVIAIESTFSSEDRATETVFGQAAFIVHPQLQTGLEGTASFTAYDQPTLNDNHSYSAGLFATWQPGQALRLKPRLGYTISKYENTSTSIRTEDVGSYYLDLDLSHDISAAFSYRFTLGHGLRAGVSADAIEESYFRPSLTWRAFRRTSIQLGGFYERGEQGVGTISGAAVENYDYYGGNIGANFQVLEKLSLGASYRATFRSSDQSNQDYNQNVISLVLTYRLG
jgi:hypothetical protein